MTDLFKTLKRTENNSIKMAMANQFSDHEDVIALSVADSDYETSPEIKQALLDRVSHGAFGYLKTPSDYESTIQKWFRRRYNVQIKTSWVFPAPKVLNAIALAINAFTKPKDDIIIQTPVYHMFYPVIKDNDRNIKESKLLKTEQGYHIDFVDLENHFKKGAKAFLLCQPHNPVGRTFTYKELEKIVALAKQYDVIIISDEIHADIIMPNHTFYSVAHFFDVFEKIIIIGAPSKTFNIAGLQIANVVIKNDTIRNNIKALYNNYHIAYPNVLAIEALRAAYQKSEYWVDAQNIHIYNNYQTLVKKLTNKYKDIWIAPLEATFLAWLDLSFTKQKSPVITKALAKQGLVVSDGLQFHKSHDSFVRINLATSKARLDEALNRFIKAIDTL